MIFNFTNFFHATDWFIQPTLFNIEATFEMLVTVKINLNIANTDI